MSAGGIFLLRTRNRRICLYFPTLGPRLVRLVALEELGGIEFVVPLLWLVCLRLSRLWWRVGKATTVVTGLGDIALLVCEAMVASFRCELAYRHFVHGAKVWRVLFFFAPKFWRNISGRIP